MADNPIQPKALTFDERRDLEAAYQKFCAHEPEVGVFISNCRFKAAMQGLVFYEMMYNRLRDEMAGDFERYFRLANCPGILTGYQPECSTIVDDICRMKAVLEQALHLAEPDPDKREKLFAQAKELAQELPAWKAEEKRMKELRHPQE